MPLPFALDHVNLWLLEDGDGWTLVDAGLANGPTRDLWRRILEGPAAGRPLRRLIATHFHPDHMGLAGWFASAHGVPLVTTRTEFETARKAWAVPDAIAGDGQARLFARHGLPAAAAAGLSARGNLYRRRAVEPPATFIPIAGGESLEIGGRTWHVIIGRGHSPELACLYCAELGLLIAGDHVLPHITPNISVVWSEPAANPLAAYLGSFGPFLDLPAGVRVLPSHGVPFDGLLPRIRAIEAHHADRLRQVAKACAGDGCTAFELLGVMFRRTMGEHDLPFAMGEALSHLALLAAQGAIAAETGRDGVARFRTMR
ncbi:MBL fold metallo-hydrolase [Arenibaculum pallidiluteum]|uniref:MBL fold metallo-hydrolase n=1 Tax=Arenibaculum pallidiluteum TaxID=2812559 RepID=UPI001F485444|nr:MBL fold metallo-hydrolase [Arenibaculum pallidiluteum]